MLPTLTLGLTAILIGCRTNKPIPPPADRRVVRIQAGSTYVATNNGWFVPDQRMYEIKNALDKARIRETGQ